jgi:hypothetical protein
MTAFVLPAQMPCDENVPTNRLGKLCFHLASKKRRLLAVEHVVAIAGAELKQGLAGSIALPAFRDNSLLCLGKPTCPLLLPWEKKTAAIAGRRRLKVSDGYDCSSVP